MGLYTIPIRNILEQYYMNDHPEMHPWAISEVRPKDICNAEYGKIFDFDFPGLTTVTKQQLCSQILMHYYMREIGLETVALWKLYLEMRMTEIMPYYVQLEAANISLADAFINRNMQEKVKRDGNQTDDNSRTNKGDETIDRTLNGVVDSTGSQNGTSSSDTTQNAESNGKNLFSDTPQDSLTAVENGTYLTNATITKEDNLVDTNVSGTEQSNSAAHSTTDSTDNVEKKASFVEDILNSREYLENVSRETFGFDGDKVDTLVRYREAILNIPKMIIDKLGDLFISIL